MKHLLLSILLIIPGILFADLSDYVKGYPAFSVDPILHSYDEITDYAEKSLWDTQFRATYGQNWRILIDIRGGTPNNAFGQGIPVLPGKGNELFLSGLGRLTNDKNWILLEVE